MNTPIRSADATCAADRMQPGEITQAAPAGRQLCGRWKRTESAL